MLALWDAVAVSEADSLGVTLIVPDNDGDWLGVEDSLGVWLGVGE